MAADRDRLMRAAAHALVTGNHDAMTSDTVCAAANVSRAAFEEHFSDIDDLCLSLLVDIGRAQIDAVTNLEPADSTSFDLLTRVDAELTFTRGADELLELETRLWLLGVHNDAMRSSLGWIQARTLGALATALEGRPLLHPRSLAVLVSTLDASPQARTWG